MNTLEVTIRNRNDPDDEPRELSIDVPPGMTAYHNKRILTLIGLGLAYEDGWDSSSEMQITIHFQNEVIYEERNDE